MRSVGVNDAIWLVGVCGVAFGEDLCLCVDGFVGGFDVSGVRYSSISK